MRVEEIPESELTEDAAVSRSVIDRGVLDLGDLEDEETSAPLRVDLIPAQMWGSNCRSEMTQRQWQYISDYVRFRAGWACEFCGRQNRPRSRFWMIAHERFAYDETRMVMRLESIVCLCPLCNNVAHPGNATLRGKSLPDIAAHYAEVADLDFEEAVSLMREATRDFNRRSGLGEFTLDLSLINPWMDEIAAWSRRRR